MKTKKSKRLFLMGKMNNIFLLVIFSLLMPFSVFMLVRKAINEEIVDIILFGLLFIVSAIYLTIQIVTISRIYRLNRRLIKGLEPDIRRVGSILFIYGFISLNVFFIGCGRYLYLYYFEEEE